MTVTQPGTKESADQEGNPFNGPGGGARLLGALKAQSLIAHDASLANDLLAIGELCAYRPNYRILSQGAPDNDIHLVLSGQVGIFVNSRLLATRLAGAHVGEMALVDPLATRSATVVATALTYTLKVPEHAFAELAKHYPDLWRRIAVEIAKRFRERNTAIREPHNQPEVFIGSSAEGLGIATIVQRQLRKKPLIPRLWTDGVFQASLTSIESLVAMASEADFAVLVLTKDDMTESRGAKKPSPRDNVIFELGLLMGAIGRTRVFILKPHSTEIKIPSDLLGVTCLEYRSRGPRTVVQRLAPASTQIAKLVAKLGPR